jgi:hypothetical protein
MMNLMTAFDFAQADELMFDRIDLKLKHHLEQPAPIYWGSREMK